MKIQLFKRASLVFVGAIASLVAGCDQAGQSSQGLLTAASAEPAVQTVAVTNVPGNSTNPEAPSTPAGKAEAVPAALEEKPLPPTIKASAPLSEVIKLAQAGVDEEVMLTFITNSTSTFSIGSDEIIYLNDIGVPNNVVTTIIEHDQAMKQFWTNAAQAQAAANAPAPAPTNQIDQTAAAPSYVNPPEAAPAEPQSTVVNNNYFYDTLSPYGSWVNVEGYGLCWQPTVVVINRSWQPYCDRGHWVYTDSGWYWISDYSWGATTFHYGRWFSHPRWGWCWWPDRVWGPSWVTWRYSGDYCGWAPLPPATYYQPGFGFSYYGSSVGFSFGFGLGASCYTFVPVSRFCDPHPYRHRLPSHQVTQVFNKTTIINNYGVGSRNTVINQGIAPDRITSVTKQEIRKVAIRDAGPSPAKGLRRERLDSNGRTLTVHRANLPENRNDRTTSRPTVTSGKASPYAPLQTTQGSADNLSRANSRTSTDNKRDELQPVKARPAFEVDRNPARSTARFAPAGGSAAGPTAPATVGSGLSRTPTTAPSSALTDAQPNRSPQANDIQRGRDHVRAPATVRGPDVTPSSPTPPTPKENSSITIIGKRNTAPQSQQRGTVSTPAPQTRVAELEQRDLQARPTTPAAAPRNYDSAPQQIQRQEIPRSTRSVETRPSYSAPAPVQRQTAPSYSPPASAPAPSPRYEPPTSSAPSYRESPAMSAPRSAPAPSYSPPASAPAPSYSPPASAPAPVQRAQPTPPSRSESGGGPRGRNQ